MSKYGITREPGESEEDFRRRYHREKMRIRRAALPKSDRKRGPGKGPSKRGTLTQAEWEALQRRPDESEDEHRRRYQRELVARSRRPNPERSKAVRLAHYAANKDTVQATAKAWRAANPDKVEASQKKYVKANRAKRAAATKAWIKANPEKHAAAKRAWDEENRAKLSAYSARWRRDCRQATPPWADFEAILRFYEEAQRLTLETGIPHHVDHVIPIKGKTVCGLHVQTNLRVITASENCQKHNTLDEELVMLFMEKDDHTT
jgi:hypothetical protein